MRPLITLIPETNIEVAENGEHSLGGAPFRNIGQIGTHVFVWRLPDNLICPVVAKIRLFGSIRPQSCMKGPAEAVFDYFHV